MATASVRSHFSGSLMGGIRHMTGIEEPAINGTNSSRDLSYIHLASAQVAARCLSLNTGTDFWYLAKVSVTPSKKRRRGYRVWPLSLRGYLPCSPIHRTPSTARSLPPSVRAH